MGGMLMIQILEKRIEEFETILLSPQSDYEKVRRFLYPYMELVEDCYVKEKNKFYRILLAKKRKEQDSSEFSKVEWEFGWLPLVKKDPVLKELLEDEKRHLEKMLSKNPQKVLEEKLERVKEGLGYYSS